MTYNPEKRKKYYFEHKEKCKEQRKKYYSEHKKEILEINKIWVSKNKDKIKKIKGKYRIKNKDKLKLSCLQYNALHKKERNAYKKIWRHNNPDKSKEEKLKNRFKISLKDYKNLLKNQDNRCGICNIPFATESKNSPCVDHNHINGKVRGLLCRRCNSGIGGLKDDPDLLVKAISWLKKATGIYVKFNNENIRRQLTAEQLKNLRQERCGICNKILNKKSNLDHNHKTLEIRGLLCPSCNRAIGFLNEDPFLIKKARQWLKGDFNEDR